MKRYLKTIQNKQSKEFKMLDKTQSDQINELATALAKAQSEMEPAIKDSANPFFKSKYADLPAIWNACKDPLTKNGLAVIQTMDFRDGQCVLITTLAHSSGQWMRSLLPIVTEKNNAQGIGSAITYMRRYALSAIAGITADDEDDDANAACRLPEKKAPSPKIETLDETISRAQFDHLSNLMKDCPSNYSSYLDSYLQKKYECNLANLPVSMFETVKSWIVKKQEEHKKASA